MPHEAIHFNPGIFMDSFRELHIISGNVQGVGFRPFIYTTALRCSLTGFVQNTHEGVRIEVQGDAKQLAAFNELLHTTLPPLALIVSHQRSSIPLRDKEAGFSIRESTGENGHNVFIGPDIATCDQCLNEILNPADRRFLYPFTNCTNCGPRYSIIRSIPYDRSSTSMTCFPMCENCAQEYRDPANRRFHAQPNACAVCGPHVWFVGEKAVRTGQTAMPATLSPTAITDAATLLAEGKILALKGLGGFHLACLATNEKAIAALRHRKNRPHKPFALMVATLEDARSIVHVTEKTAALLTSPAHPIVLCPKRKQEAQTGTSPIDTGPLHDPPPHRQVSLPDSIAPDTDFLGVMLAYTPLHHILLHTLSQQCEQIGYSLPPVLVMTSGNRGGEPICLGNREALQKLGDIAQGFLLHDRDILIRVDDSVLAPLPDGKTIIFRRARGYAPLPLALPPAPMTPPMLGLGAELKNTICISKGDNAFVSQHMGDMQHVEATAFHDEIVEHLQHILMVKPRTVIHDKHPNYYTTRKARELNMPRLALQHHAAHAFAVLGENAVMGKSLVLALDGTGYGDDGTLWGGEAIMADMESGHYSRLGSFSPLPLPGGEAAITEPWRIAHALCFLQSIDPSTFPWLPQYASVAQHIPVMVEKNINTPLSTSCGRLFDAISALLGEGVTTSYEGQAAIRLEALALKAATAGRILPCPLYMKDGFCTLNTNKLFAAVCEEIQAGMDRAAIALSFHESLVSGLTIWAKTLCTTHGLNHVGLSGGCFNNALLLSKLTRALEALGLTPVIHTKLPCGDGCIAYGQVVWGTLSKR